MEQLVILVIIGLISLVNWLMQRAAEQREQAKLKRAARDGRKREEERNIYTQPPPVPAPGRHAPPAPQDPFKELMEALGLPSGEPPPPPVTRQAPPPPVTESEEFASLEEAVPTAKRAKRPAQPAWKQPPKRRAPDEKEARLASAFAAQESAAGRRPARERESVRSLLATRASQRQAIILAEILGQPRAIRSWEGTPVLR